MGVAGLVATRDSHLAGRAPQRLAMRTGEWWETPLLQQRKALL
jgi:hypothetical protein